MRLAPINQAQPVNWSHPLNQGKSLWWLALPHVIGGNRFTDLVANDATLANFGSGYGWQPTSRPGGAMEISCDGTDDYISANKLIGDLPSGGSARTFCFWVKVRTAVSTAVIMITRVASGQNFQGLNYYAGTAYIFGDAVNAGNNVTATGSEIPTIGQWTHFAQTLNSSNGWSNYVNGNLTRSGTFAVAINTETAGLEVGRRAGIGYFDGSIDDISVYNRDLSASEVLGLYNESLAGYPTMLNRLDSPIARLAASSGGPFPWYLDSSAMSGGLQTMGL